MPCWLIEAADGTRRSVPMGKSYVRKEGEKILGVDLKCDGNLMARRDNVDRQALVQEVQQFEKELKHEADQRGIGLGDAVKKVTDFLQIEPCARCVQRQRRWNKVKLRWPKMNIDWDAMLGKKS